VRLAHTVKEGEEREDEREEVDLYNLNRKGCTVKET
jgi:hypothetical protein